MNSTPPAGRITAPKPVRPEGLWVDDLAVGMTFSSGTYELTAEAVIAFAGAFDPQVFHLDADEARGTFFDGMVASGWHTAAITMRLLVTSGLPIATGLIGASVAVTWPTPALPGDILHLDITIDDIRPSRSRPDRATVVVSYETINQHDQVRQRTTVSTIAWRRPPAGAWSSAGVNGAGPR